MSEFPSDTPRARAPAIDKPKLIERLLELQADPTRFSMLEVAEIAGQACTVLTMSPDTLPTDTYRQTLSSAALDAITADAAARKDDPSIG